MRTVEQATREHVQGLDAQQSPVGWDEIVARSRTGVVAAGTGRSVRSRGVLVFAAAVAVVILIGLIPLLLQSTEEPTPITQPPAPPTTVVTPTTITRATPTTAVGATSDEPISPPTTDLDEALAGALERDDRYRALSLHTSRDGLPPLPLHGEPWDIVPDDVVPRDWAIPWDWSIHPRSEDLFAVLVPAPETMLQVWTEVWLARFDDAEAATAFVADYAGAGWAWIPCGGRCPGSPADPLRFGVEVSADESFGFTEEGFSTVVGVRQGSIVAIAGIPHHDHPLRPVAGMIEEGRYLAASLAAGIAGEVAEVEPPFVEPFTEEQSDAITLIQQFHEALSEGDYRRIRSMVRLSSYHEPPFTEQLAYGIDRLLEVGAVFAATECRPTTGEGDPVEEVFSVECLAGYRNGTDHFEYHRFFYDRGKLTEGGHLGGYGEPWEPPGN